jgi:hypothetical protein
MYARQCSRQRSLRPTPWRRVIGLDKPAFEAAGQPLQPSMHPGVQLSVLSRLPSHGQQPAIAETHFEDRGNRSAGERLGGLNPRLERVLDRGAGKAAGHKAPLRRRCCSNPRLADSTRLST